MIRYPLAIVEKKIISKDLFLIIVENKVINLDIKPGEFFMAYVNDRYLGVPLACFEKISNHKFSVLIKAFGPGTKELYYKPITQIIALGTCGAPTPLVKGKNIIIMAGGAGLSTVLELTKSLVKDNSVVVCLSFRHISDVYGIEKYEKYVDRNKILVSCDETNTKYFHGNILQMIQKYKPNFNFIYACGSRGMLKAIDLNFPGMDGYLINEASMACGFGVCAACSVPLKNKFTQRVCLNPNFKLGTINYD